MNKKKSMRFNFFKLVVLIPLCTFGQTRITIDAAKAKDTISKHIYGHFAEHLGHCIYGGLYVGDTNKTIPHKDGVRLDVIEALKKLKVPVLR